MKLTLSVIKADIGSIGGHIAPSHALLETVRQAVRERSGGLLLDHYISFTGDDIAILMTHTRGVVDPAVHKLAWDAFVAGTATAKAQGLYGAGQDLLAAAFEFRLDGNSSLAAKIGGRDLLLDRSDLGVGAVEQDCAALGLQLFDLGLERGDVDVGQRSADVVGGAGLATDLSDDFLKIHDRAPDLCLSG